MQFISYDNWQLDKQNCDPDALQQFSSVEKVFSCNGELIVKDKISEVIKFYGSTKTYYIKRYTASGKKFRSFFRKSLICSEWENLVSLKKMGLPVPNLIAHGEKMKNGHFLGGALITEEVKNSANLAQHLSSNTDLINNKKWLYSVIDQIAHYIHEMHDHKFIHRDLNLRNILVQTLGNPAVYFIDCPAGGFKKGFYLKRGIIRDLAHLDKVARYLMSTKDLLRFYKKYKQIDKLTPDDKKLIAQIHHFHDKHRAKQNRNADNPYRVL
jgi:tRNA A-37 threonylcarbamoyl transferase component Bud32